MGQVDQQFLLRPVRLVAQDTALSRRRQGFDSPTGYFFVWSTDAIALARTSARFPGLFL